jgi:hypothetical protein
MFRRNPGLRVIAGKDVALRGLGQPRQSDLNLPPVPERAILLLQQQQPA